MAEIEVFVKSALPAYAKPGEFSYPRYGQSVFIFWVAMLGKNSSDMATH